MAAGLERFGTCGFLETTAKSSTLQLRSRIKQMADNPRLACKDYEDYDTCNSGFHRQMETLRRPVPKNHYFGCVWDKYPDGTIAEVQTLGAGSLAVGPGNALGLATRPPCLSCGGDFFEGQLVGYSPDSLDILIRYVICVSPFASSIVQEFGTWTFSLLMFSLMTQRRIDHDNFSYSAVQSDECWPLASALMQDKHVAVKGTK